MQAIQSRGDYQCGFASRVVGDLRYFWQARIDRCIKKLRLDCKTRFVFRKFSCGEACMLLQGDGSPGHSLHSIYDFCLLSTGIWRGSKKLQKRSHSWVRLGSKWATKSPINFPSIPIERGAVIVHSAAPGRDLCCALGNRESFGNRARQPKGCAADTAAGPA